MNPASAPQRITDEVLEFCREIIADGEPIFLELEPATGAQPRDCFPVVNRHAKEHGGTVCYGWAIWEWPGVMIEAEFHAVWRDPNGRLHDLTPKLDGAERILFLPDRDRAYEDRQVSNIRRAISDRPDVREFIAAAEAEFEFLNRGERAAQHDITLGDLTPADQLEILHILEKKENAFNRILGRTGQPARAVPRPGRNEPCHCGSGKKFKKCHGSAM